MISFYDVRVHNAEVAASRKRTVINNEITKSEIYMIIELDNQRMEFDIEQPKGTDKKNPLNTFFFYKYGNQGCEDRQMLDANKSLKPKNSFRITFEERIYKLEKDEQAFIDSLKQINTKNSSAINSFLMKRTGGFGAAEGGDLNSMIKKKKLLQKVLPILTTDIPLEMLISEKSAFQEVHFSEMRDFSINIDQELNVTGIFQVNESSFVKMPKGRLELEFVGNSRFCKGDENLEFEGVVFKLTKQVSKATTDNLTYIIRPSGQDSWKMVFDTYFFDDVIKVEAYQKNSTNKVNLIGKGTIDVRELELSNTL